LFTRATQDQVLIDGAYPWLGFRIGLLVDT
jgi:hypothetical protein